MSQKYEKLNTLLKELFQLDQPDLDFGLYRVLHAKSAEVSQFLEKDLLPQVKTAFDQYKTADKAELEKELSQVIAGIDAAGMKPADSPKVKELRVQLRSDAVDIGTLESEVYDHLYSFFRRYYSEGDFLAKRVYKPGVYAIPYEGEEVMLHWANKDQYYVKTSEYLRDYAFRLRPAGREEFDARALPPGGCCRGRARQPQGRRGQGPRYSFWRRPDDVAATSSPRRTVGTARNSSFASSTARRLSDRLARGRTRRKEEAPGPEGPDHARRQARSGRGRRRIDAVDRRARQAARHGERGAGRLQPAGGAS